MCEALRTLELTCVKLKAYIDQILAVVLESDPNLLEGMPRIQQSTGMKLELFRMASLQEVYNIYMALCGDGLGEEGERDGLVNVSCVRYVV